MRLAQIPFTNAAPFFHRLDPAWLAGQELIPDAPRDLGDLARSGGVDAGLFSLVDVWDLERRGLFEPIGALGVASHGPIRSILLFGARRPEDLEGADIAVSGQTATSVRLMEAWLREKVGLRRYRLVPLGSPAPACLLIADQALARALSLSPGDPGPLDLGREWNAWTGSSFVFARWAVRRSLPQGEKRALLEAVTASLDHSLKDLDGFARDLSSRTGFPRDFLKTYVSGIRYRLGPDEEEGMTLFRAKWERLAAG